MNVCVIGGMHGNERLGIALVEALKSSPVAGVGAIIANPEAVAINSRFTEKDLNRCFPGSPTGESYEDRRAVEVLEFVGGFDLVLDFHNTGAPDNDCCFVGQTATDELYAVAQWLDLGRVIAADYDCVNKFVSRCLSIEVSDTSERNSVDYWLDRVSRLARLAAVPTYEKLDVARYRFVRRLSLDDRDTYGLLNYDLAPFRQLPRALADALGVDRSALTIFVNDPYTPYNYGGVIEPVKR